MSETTDSQSRPLAVVTGASSGIGLELARLCAADGFDLVIAADEAEIETVATELRRSGVAVEAVTADLSSLEGVGQLVAAIGERPVHSLFANAGQALGKGFLDQDLDRALEMVNTNITGTLALIHHVGNAMRARGEGHILITGSIAGFMPGAFMAVYNGTKAFLNSFSFALRNELKGTGVTVSCLMPGPTNTEIFARGDMLDTSMARDVPKEDPAKVARTGYEALKKGEGDVVSGWSNKIQAALANVTPAPMLAEMNRKLAEPGSAKT